MNWSLPSITDAYVNVLQYLKDRADALAFMFDPASVTVSNMPVNARRYNAANRRWELNNGTTWIEMEANYNISADRFNGQAPSYYTNIVSRLGYTPVNKAGDTINGALTVVGDFVVDGFAGRTAQKSASMTYVMCDTDLPNTIRWYEYNSPYRGVYLNLAAGAAGANSEIFHTGNFNPATKQNALGFTPVRQGGTALSSSNVVFIGWDNAGLTPQNLQLKVDATEFYNVWPINISGNATTATDATNAVSKTSTSIQQMSGTLTGQLSGGNMKDYAGSVGFEVRSAGSTHDAFHNIYIPGVFNLNFGLNRLNQRLSIGGGSLGANVYKIWTEQDFNADIAIQSTETKNVDSTGAILTDVTGYTHYPYKDYINKPSPHLVRYNRYWDTTPPPVDSGGGNDSLHPHSRIEMADGLRRFGWVRAIAPKFKALQDLLPGDMVVGENGPEEVVGMRDGELGNKDFVTINGKCVATPGHLLPLEGGKWGAVDPACYEACSYGKHKSVKAVDGVVTVLSGICEPSELVKIEIGMKIKKVDGTYEEVRTIERAKDFSPHQQTIAVLLKKGKLINCDGYLVGTLA